MSDGLSDYMRTNPARQQHLWGIYRAPALGSPIVPRREDIRVINPSPPYFWLGREAEAA